MADKPRTGRRHGAQACSTLILSVPPKLIEALDAEVAKSGEASGGFRQSRAEVVRRLLVAALAQRRDKQADSIAA